MQDASDPKHTSLIKLGKLANTQKFDQLEEHWPEAVANPVIELKWKGWRGECREIRDLVGGFKRFIMTEVLPGRRSKM